MSNPQPTKPSQELLQYSIDWNNVALQAITAGLDQIPVVGDILSHLVFAFWPPSGEDVWAEIKQKVEALINQSISEDDYNRVQTELGSVSQGSGLIGVLNNYLGSVNPDPNQNNGMQPQSTWGSADQTFTYAQSSFQQKGSELLLLPLFAQFANMHLSLLRDGVKQNWVNVSELQSRIADYSQWVDTWYQLGYANRLNQGFNYLNQYVQGMQISVLNFRETWPYFDPTKYPPPVKVSFTNQTYFTITGSLGRQSANYNLPAIPTDQITNIDVYWLEDLYDDYNFVLGTQVNYADTQEPYTGVLVSGAVPPINTPCDPNNDYYCYFKNSVAVSPDNPIVAVQGVYDSTGGTYCVNFIYKNGSSTGEIPSQNQQDYPNSYNIAPPSGYYLSSVWVPPDTFFYGSAVDMIFGFRYIPPNLDQATARALYVSSLQPISQDDARFAPFAAVAASENWERQRQEVLSIIKGAAKP